ncbi:MAG TPA: hypothetical protein PKA82_15645 [Pyrinomonadaceae bacterium]|nr:hypothetical protein [Pyrinomonadaceae bacterium]
MKRKNILIVVVVLGLIYLGSYFGFRQTHIENWEQDKLDYVIFPAGGQALYYLYRPLTYADSAITGMRFHIGPHR